MANTVAAMPRLPSPPLPRLGRALRVFLLTVAVIVIIGVSAALLRLSCELAPRPVSSDRTVVRRPESARPAAPGASRLALTEAELTSQLRAAAGGQVTDIAVDCRPGVLVVTGNLDRGPVRLPARVVVEPFVEAGAVSIRIRQASLGPLPLPREVSDTLAARARQMLAQEQRKIPGLVVDGVEVTDSEIVLTGHFESSAG